MVVFYEKSLLKDIKKIQNKKVKARLKEIFQNFEQAESLTEIHNIKKLSGHAGYYRLRIGDYRLGFFYEDGNATMIRILHRKDIYKEFP